MKEQNWIESILKTPQYIREVDAHPRLIHQFKEKISADINIETIENSLSFKWVAAAMLLVLLNISAIIYHTQHHVEKGISKQKKQLNQFDNSTTYNY